MSLSKSILVRCQDTFDASNIRVHHILWGVGVGGGGTQKRGNVTYTYKPARALHHAIWCRWDSTVA